MKYLAFFIISSKKSITASEKMKERVFSVWIYAGKYGLYLSFNIHILRGTFFLWIKRAPNKNKVWVLWLDLIPPPCKITQMNQGLYTFFWLLRRINVWLYFVHTKKKMQDQIFK